MTTYTGPSCLVNCCVSFSNDINHNFLPDSIDVFHWDCLNKFASSLPPNTAPAGYTCPNCKVIVCFCVYNVLGFSSYIGNIIIDSFYSNLYSM